MPKVPRDRRTQYKDSIYHETSHVSLIDGWILENPVCMIRFTIEHMFNHQSDAH